jgi:hypothetical protein
MEELNLRFCQKSFEVVLEIFVIHKLWNSFEKSQTWDQPTDERMNKEPWTVIKLRQTPKEIWTKYYQAFNAFVNQNVYLFVLPMIFYKKRSTDGKYLHNH